MGFSTKLTRTLRAAVQALESRWGRRTFWAAVVAAFVVFGVITVRRAEFPKRIYVPRLQHDSPMDMGTKADKQAKYHSSEFMGFRKLSWGTIALDLDPYVKPFHVRAYPPFFGIAFFPFTALWQIRGAGSALFYLVSFEFALISAWCCSRLFRRGDRGGRFGLFALFFLLLLPLALNVMARCESDMLVLAPVCVAFLWLAQGRKSFQAGALLGFAAAFKILPGLFGVYLLCTRRWRALLGMIAGGLFCTVVLPLVVWGPQRAWDLHVSWYRHVVAPYHSEGAEAVIGKTAERSSNQSMSAALNRYLRPVGVKTRRGGEPLSMNVAWLTERQVRWVVKVLHACIGLGIILVWILCTPKGERPLSRVVLFATVGPAILLLSEISLTTHHVLLVPALAAIIVRATAADGDDHAQRWAWTVIVYLLALAGVAIPHVKIFTPMLPATLALLVACVVLAIGDRRRTASEALAAET